MKPMIATPVLQVGRVGLDLALENPMTMRLNSQPGSRDLSVSGLIKGFNSLAQAEAVRAELLSQVGDIIPLTSTLDPNLNGYYFLGGVIVNIDRNYLPYQQFIFPFSASLAKLEGAAFEVSFDGGLMPNDHGIIATANKGFVGVGPSDHLRWLRHPSGDFSSTIYQSSSGPIRAFRALDPEDSGLRFSVPPENFYDGACLVWVNDRLRTGVNLTFSDTDEVHITNGLIALTFSEGEAAFSVNHYLGAAWSADKTYELIGDSGGIGTNWTEARIVRNSPEMVTVQLVKPRVTTGHGFYSLIVTIKRGWRVAVAELLTDVPESLGVQRATSEGATALSSGEGIVATSADGEGNKYLIVSPDAHDTNLTVGSITLTQPTRRITFGIGSVVNSASPDTGANTQDLVDQFFNFLIPRQLTIQGVF